MNAIMETKLSRVSEEDLEKALYNLIASEVNALIDGSDLAVELATEIEDADAYSPPAIWAWDDADTALEDMSPSDIIDAVSTGENDPERYWRRINPETNQMESYGEGFEVIDKSLCIIGDNISDYLASCGTTGRDTVLDMIGADLEDLCAELGIEDEPAEIESVELFDRTGDNLDIEDTLCSPAIWGHIVGLMEDDIRETVHAELAPCTEYDFLIGYLKLDAEMPDKIKNVFGYTLEIEYA